MSMRVFKFIPAQYGKQALEHRRLKVSAIDDLNDPFDHNAIDTTEPTTAWVVTNTIAEYKRKTGLVCFSRNWSNLLLWSHYADSHRGICLGFDISDNPGKYLDVRYQPNLLRMNDLSRNPIDFAQRMLTTKHESWSYEQEVRMFVGLEDPPDKEGLSWISFGPELQLTEVIIGVQCRPTDADAVCAVLGSYPEKIECTWAYMRSDAFLLVRNTVAHVNVFRPSERAFEISQETMR